MGEEFQPPLKEGETRTTTNMDHPGGITTAAFKDDKPYGMRIVVRPEYKEGEKDAYRVWIHEFGHALGLGHDRTESSIMYLSIEARPGELSEKDVRLLRDAYGDKDAKNTGN